MHVDTDLSVQRSYSVSPNESGKNLWVSLKKGNEEALTKLFCIYYTPLFTYGIKIIPNEEVVKDCIQELFVTLWDRRTNINQAHSVKSYLLSSLRRTILRKLQKQKKQYERNKKYLDDFFEDSLNAEQMIINFEKKEQDLYKLKKAIDSLGKRHREAIYLKFYEGLNNNEIAVIMNINRQSVYNYVSDGICQLQSFID